MSWLDFLPIAVAVAIYLGGCAVIPFLPSLFPSEPVDFGPTPEEWAEETSRKGGHEVAPGDGS